MGKAQNYVVEMVGTFFLCLTIQLSGALSGLAPIGIGSILMCMIYMGGYISGAAYNPAVALGLLIRKKLDVMDFAMYCVFEIIGGLLGAVMGTLIRDHALSWPLAPVIADAGKALGVEIFYTFGLVFTVLSTATSSPTSGNSFYGLCIGMSVTAGAIVGGSTSGGHFNPAVGIANYVTAAIFDTPNNSFGDIWIPLVGPFVGGAVAGVAYMFTNPAEFGKGDAGLVNKCLSEFIGTFFLVLTVGLSGLGGALAPFAIGTILMVHVYNGAHIAGGQLNPAVSLGVFLRGKQDIKQMLIFWGVQILAGILAAFLAFALTPVGAAAVQPAVPELLYSVLQALVGEILFTFALVSVVLFTATTDSQAGNSHFGLAIGFTVLSGATAMGGISGAAFNPAVAIGTTLIAVIADTAGATMEYIWIYLVGPLVGGALAALFYKFANIGQGDNTPATAKVNVQPDDDVAA